MSQIERLRISKKWKDQAYALNTASSQMRLTEKGLGNTESHLGMKPEPPHHATFTFELFSFFAQVAMLISEWYEAKYVFLLQ